MRSPADRDDGGFTLIEMLLVVMLLGVGFVAVLGGMATTMISSTLHRDQAQAETEVRRYAEVIKEAATSTSCPADYSTVSFPVTAKGPDGVAFTASPPVVDRYLNIDPTTKLYVAGACTATSVQVVRVSVTSADGKATETVEVVKRPTT